MIHTIQADFYRLFRSKGFWITEFILFTLMLMGASIGPRASDGNPDRRARHSNHGWDGIQALD